DARQPHLLRIEGQVTSRTDGDLQDLPCRLRARPLPPIAAQDPLEKADPLVIVRRLLVEVASNSILLDHGPILRTPQAGLLPGRRSGPNCAWGHGSSGLIETDAGGQCKPLLLARASGTVAISRKLAAALC